MSTIRETPAPGPVTVRRALLSASDKAGLVPFAQALQARGVTLLSTGGTAKALADAGLPVVNVADVTKFPEMLDGRVKTLHPNVHGGILARRHVPDDLAAIGAHGIEPIDLVVVNLYPFAKAAANPATRLDGLIEEIDIGGPSMVRAAAKNWRDVLIVTDPADYARVLDDLASPEGSSPAFRFDLARRAFAHTAAYDAMIATALEAIGTDADPFGRPAEPPALPVTMRVTLPRRRMLRYGENPHQAAGWYATEPAQGFGAVEIRQGKELSYTNLLDLDAAARIALEFDEPAAAVIKHANPCGVATAATIAEAYVTAREADALSAFGGIIGLNRELDADTATAITSTFIEAVIAPSVTPAALEILAARKNLRVLTADFGAFRDAVRPGVELRSILGGVLVQERDRVLEARAAWPDAAADGLKVVTKRQPTAAEWQALRFAWRVCAHVKSNTILFAGADRTRAVGAGQMSRVDAVKVAVMKAGGAVPGSVVASDAFFPFRDGLDALAAAGATAVVQPGGSLRDAEVIAAADEHGLAMVFTGRRHFRH
jgi:phosphoribosylaminoimidazolecarboxamide formyltransferase/IMP cyclohydrolase